MALLLLFWTGCQESPPPEPSAIAVGDTCLRCKKPILESRFAAEFATKDGFIRKFDDIGCMIDHAKKVGKGSISEYYTMDYDRNEWMKAADALFVKSERFKTPNDGGVLSVGDKSRADSLASQYEAKVLAFSELTEVDFSGLAK